MSLLIVDTNVLAAALFGRSLGLLRDLDLRGFALITPRAQAEELERVAPIIAGRQGKPGADPAFLWRVIDIAERQEYDPLEDAARPRLQAAAQSDWPVLALALACGAPVMTRDRDLFGTGVVTWTPANIQFATPEPMP